MKLQQKVIEGGIFNRDLTWEEMCEELGWPEETFKFRFKKFCERYSFRPEDFQEKGAYLFRKEWNEILYVLLNSIHEHPLYREGNTEKTAPFDKMVHYYRQLLDDIEDCLPRDIRMDLMSHPIYLNTKLEFSMMEKLQEKMGSWMSLVTTMPPRVRVMMWQKMNHSMDEWAKILCAVHVRAQEIQQLLESDEYLSEGEKEAQLEHLDVLLAHRLRKEINRTKFRMDEKIIAAMQHLDQIALGLRRFIGEEEDSKYVKQEFERRVLPILDEQDRKREGILTNLLIETQRLVDQWREIGRVLADLRKELDEMTELPDKEKEKYKRAAETIGEVYRQLSSERTKQFLADVEGLFQKSVATSVAKSQEMIRSER
ncbi:hypothetical protein KDJ56_20400 [Brevibacillus composti]|uniref:Uncharacterized protein n=1 Tax=Brevibacillus composti TaxID=2796470 RepID=A0A7T5EKC9_9BACL|nr:hypothetical protein [Brevibacillus composti]QQE74172.1 hypothetical protein JD108_20465 [Brevibacillus composti]QUO41255.1 hypothetical protein KDJ56_20400 [Brevibacillus composti]